MIPIVTYHAIGSGPRPLWVPVKEFEAHLDAFRKAGYTTISMTCLIDCLRKDELPTNALVITFDDGYEGVYSLAWPRLRAAGLGATVFLISDYCGRTNQWPGQSSDVPKAPLLEWEQVMEMAAQGCEFGAHTRTHPNLVQSSSERVTEELVSAQHQIQSVTGRTADVFAYPYGEADGRTVDFVSKYYRGAVGTKLGIVRRNSDPFMLPRIDAYYLTPSLIRRMKDPSFRVYLGARQGLRSLRRLLK